MKRFFRACAVFIVVLAVELPGASVVTELRQKAEAGDASAQYELGDRYTSAEGVSQNFVEAAKWFRLAAEQGHARAQHRLGILYADGDLLRVGKDAVEAAKWFRRAADQGIDEAQYNLGAMYARGEGVPKDPDEAVKWYRRAAEGRNSFLQALVGETLAKGEGVPKDVVEGHAWLNVAGASGIIGAKKTLAEVERGMTREQIAAASKLARELFEKYGPKE